MNTAPVMFSAEAERAVLGSILINPDAFNEAALIVRPSDFHLQAHRWTYDAMIRLSTSGQSVDLLTVTKELQRTGHDDLGGAAWVSGLVNDVPTSLHVASYAGIVHRDALRRALLAAASDIARASYREDLDIAEFVAETVTRLVSLAQTPGGAVHISEIVNALHADIEDAMANPRDVFGYSTGLRDVDELTGGLQRGEQSVWSGKSGKGKSKLAAQIGFTVAHHLTAGGVPVAMYSMEMGAKQVARRQLSAMSNIPTRPMRTGRLADKDIPLLVDSITRLSSSYNLFISDSTGWTTSSLRADVARLKNEQGVGVVVLDYLEMLQDDFGGEADYVKSARLSTRCRRIARDLDVHMLVIQRTNKAGLAAAVTEMSNISGGAGVIFDADLVGVLNDFIPADENEKQFPEQWRKNLSTVIFEKVREDAPRRYVHLVNRPGIPAFGDYVPDEAIAQPKRPEARTTGNRPAGAAPAYAGSRHYPSD